MARAAAAERWVADDCAVLANGGAPAMRGLGKGVLGVDAVCDEMRLLD